MECPAAREGAAAAPAAGALNDANGNAGSATTANTAANGSAAAAARKKGGGRTRTRAAKARYILLEKAAAATVEDRDALAARLEQMERELASGRQLLEMMNEALAQKGDAGGGDAATAPSSDNRPSDNSTASTPTNAAPANGHGGGPTTTAAPSGSASDAKANGGARGPAAAVVAAQANGQANAKGSGTAHGLGGGDDRAVKHLNNGVNGSAHVSVNKGVAAGGKGRKDAAAVAPQDVHLGGMPSIPIPLPQAAGGAAAAAAPAGRQGKGKAARGVVLPPPQAQPFHATAPLPAGGSAHGYSHSHNHAYPRTYSSAGGNGNNNQGGAGVPTIPLPQPPPPQTPCPGPAGPLGAPMGSVGVANTHAHVDARTGGRGFHPAPQTPPVGTAALPRPPAPHMPAHPPHDRSGSAHFHPTAIPPAPPASSGGGGAWGAAGTVYADPLVVGLLGQAGQGKSSVVHMLCGTGTPLYEADRLANVTARLGYTTGCIYRTARPIGAAADGTGAPEYGWEMRGGSEPPSAGEPAVVHEPSGLTCEFVRRVSLLDTPGGGDGGAMGSVVASLAVVDAAVVVVSANDPFPQPVTLQHLSHLAEYATPAVVVQSKIDLVGEAAAAQVPLLQGLFGPAAPIVPTCAVRNLGKEALIRALAGIPPPASRRALQDTPPLFRVVRSRAAGGDDAQQQLPADTDESPPQHAVLGGALAQGVLAVGDALTLYPGTPAAQPSPAARDDDDPTPPPAPVMQPLRANVVGITCEGAPMRSVAAGMLVDVEVTLPGTIAARDGLVGQIAGCVGAGVHVHTRMLPVVSVTRSRNDKGRKVKPLAAGEHVAVTAGGARCVGTVASVEKSTLSIALHTPLFTLPNERVAVWRAETGAVAAWGVVLHVPARRPTPTFAPPGPGLPQLLPPYANHTPALQAMNASGTLGEQQQQQQHHHHHPSKQVSFLSVVACEVVESESEDDGGEAEGAAAGDALTRRSPTAATGARAARNPPAASASPSGVLEGLQYTFSEPTTDHRAHANSARGFASDVGALQYTLSEPAFRSPWYNSLPQTLSEPGYRAPTAVTTEDASACRPETDGNGGPGDSDGGARDNAAPDRLSPRGARAPAQSHTPPPLSPEAPAADHRTLSGHHGGGVGALLYTLSEPAFIGRSVDGARPAYHPLQYTLSEPGERLGSRLYQQLAASLEDDPSEGEHVGGEITNGTAAAPPADSTAKPAGPAAVAPEKAPDAAAATKPSEGTVPPAGPAAPPRFMTPPTETLRYNPYSITTPFLFSQQQQQQQQQQPPSSASSHGSGDGSVPRSGTASPVGSTGSSAVEKTQAMSTARDNTNPDADEAGGSGSRRGNPHANENAAADGGGDSAAGEKNATLMWTGDYGLDLDMGYVRSEDERDDGLRMVRAVWGGSEPQPQPRAKRADRGLARPLFGKGGYYSAPGANGYGGGNPGAHMGAAGSAHHSTSSNNNNNNHNTNNSGANNVVGAGTGYVVGEKGHVDDRERLPGGGGGGRAGRGLRQRSVNGHGAMEDGAAAAALSSTAGAAALQVQPQAPGAAEGEGGGSGGNPAARPPRAGHTLRLPHGASAPAGDYEVLLHAALQQVYRGRTAPAPADVVCPALLVEIAADGTKSVVANFADVAASLRRNPEHIRAYIANELSVTATFNAAAPEQLLLHRVFLAKSLEVVLRRYTCAFVRCETCGGHTDVAHAQDGLWQLICTYCRASRVQPNTLQLHTP